MRPTPACITDGKDRYYLLKCKKAANIFAEYFCVSGQIFLLLQASLEEMQRQHKVSIGIIINQFSTKHPYRLSKHHYFKIKKR